MTATALRFYFRFHFRDVAHLGRSKSTSIPNFAEISQSMASILLIRFLKTNVRHVGILLPVLVFTFASPSACHSASAYQISSKSDYPRQSYDDISIFQDGGNCIVILFPVSVIMTSLIWEGEIYLHTKFRRDISIHGRYTTTSGFWKQTSAMLEFYFLFQFLRLCHHRHVILHLPTKFRPNRTICDRVMTSYPFFKMVSPAIFNYLKVTADHPRSANRV